MPSVFASGKKLKPPVVREKQFLLPRTPLMSFKCADLFAGAGGLAVGFHAAGFECRFFNEICPLASETFVHNFPDSEAFVRPIEDLSASDVFRACGLGIGELDVVVGGPPCQGFSIYAPKRSEADARNHLFRHYVRLVLEGIKPKFILMENVPGLVSLDGGQTLRQVVTAFESAGYSVSFKILNAAHYGVPEERWRLFILGSRISTLQPQFPQPQHFSIRRTNFTGARKYTFSHAVGTPDATSLFQNDLLPPISVANAISDLPIIDTRDSRTSEATDYASDPEHPYQSAMRKSCRKITNHHCNGLQEINVERMRHVPPGGSWRDIPRHLLPEGMRRARLSDHTRRYGRLHPDEPSGTILTRCDPHWGTFYHYNQERIISVREAARIQSFPDWFEFKGSCTDQYRQVGNAVPPLLAKAIAMTLRQMLESQVGK